MADGEAARHADPIVIDFERAYRDGTIVDGVVLDRMPWDTGRPQPVLVALEQDGLISGAVLDVGCGTGDNAIFLAIAATG